MTRQTIFRTDAVNRYRQGRGKDVLPHLISPGVFVALWVMLGALLVVMGWLFLVMNAQIGG
ncbi:MAG TPA: hypothetical protein VKY19_24695 [Ktedonosporobacter sp.]|jgi:hypothetical protein|nr:hypothetical protein [Ktedonosporobacter sp.]